MSSVDDQQHWAFWHGEWYWRKNGDSDWELQSGDTWWMDSWGQWQRRWEEKTQSDRGTSGGTGPAGVSTVDPVGDAAGSLGGAQRDGAQCWEPAGAGTGPSGFSTGGSDDAWKEIEDLRTFPAWATFVDSVRRAISGAPRQSLSQHVTTSCQPRRMPGVSESLNSCGADVKHQRNGMYECHVALKNLLKPGDGLALNYVSVGHTRFKDAQVAAFVEILSYILFRGPQYLRTHENQWHAARLQAVRRDAEEELRDRLGPRRNGQWSPLAAPSSSEEYQVPRTSTQRAEYQPPAADENSQDRDNEILQALSQVPRRRTIRGGVLPKTVWQVLRCRLPVRGLLPFLQRFPEQFEVMSVDPLVWQRL